MSFLPSENRVVLLKRRKIEKNACQMNQKPGNLKDGESLLQQQPSNSVIVSVSVGSDSGEGQEGKVEAARGKQ